MVLYMMKNVSRFGSYHMFSLYALHNDSIKLLPQLILQSQFFKRNIIDRLENWGLK